MIAKKITIARQEKKEIIHKQELTKLSDFALKIVALNYMLYPDLKGLDHKSKLRVYDLTCVDHPIDVVFPLIEHEQYWQRACEKHYKSVDCSMNGNSWKQCYSENYIKRLVSNFNLEKGDTIEGVLNYFNIMKFNIFNLEIPTFSTDFNISKIPLYFLNMTSLELKYSPILSEKKDDTNILRKKLEPIKDEYTRFGMQMGDLKQFAISLGELNYLLCLTLQGNYIDDEMVTWLVSGLICNHTLRSLDLSNNKISDKGMVKVSSYLMRTRCLISLDVTNNKIGGRGGFALSLVIKENTMLKKIKLGMNRLDDIGGAKIIKALAKNDSLDHLDLSSNDLGAKSTDDLVVALKANKSLKILDLSHNNILFNDELRVLVEQHQTLIKLDLRATKCSQEDLNKIETCLIKKSVRQDLLNRKIKINN